MTESINELQKIMDDDFSEDNGIKIEYSSTVLM